MPQYASTVSAFLELRDNYAAERTPEDHPRDVKYKTIAELAIATRGSSPSAMELCKQAIGSSDMTTFGDVEVLNALTNTHSPNHNALQQGFQIARSLDQMDNEEDRRVKDYYRLCQARRFPFTIRYLLADIVRSCVDGMSLRRKGRDEVTTERATRFQVVLYLSMFVLLTQRMKALSKKRKRSGSTDDLTQPQAVPLKNFGDQNWNRIAYGVQQVVRSWENFATYLGFHNTESMLSAYLSFDGSSLLFKPLKTRIEGFVPLRQSFSLIGDITPRTTSSGVDSHAYALPQHGDEGLRILAEEFLNDIFTVISHPRLYEKGVEQWLLLLEFLPDVKRAQLDPQHTRHGSYPQRFDRLSKNLWAPIRTANAKVPPTSSGEGQTSTVRTLEVIDLVTSPNDELEPDTPPEQPLRPQDADSEAAPNVQPTTYLPYDVEGTGVFLPDEDVSGTVWKAMEIVEREMMKHYAMYSTPYDELPPVHNTLRSTDSVPYEDAQFALLDAPTLVRAAADRRNSEYDALTVAEMKGVVSNVTNVLREGGHFVLFCSVELFLSWRKMFRNATLKDEDGNDEPVFKVDACPLHFITGSGNITAAPGRASGELMTIVEYTVHGVKVGASREQEQSQVNYMNFNHVSSTVAGYKNVIDNVPTLDVNETLMWSKLNPNGQLMRERVRAVQKPIRLARELIARFSNQGDMVVDLFAGTFSTALACMSFKRGEGRKFVGCEKDPACFYHAKHAAIKFFSRLIAEDIANVTVPQGVLDAARLVSNYFQTYIRPSKVWTPPKHFPPYQRFPQHIMFHCASKWNDNLFACKHINTELSQWPAHYQGALNLMDAMDLRAVEGTSSRLVIAKYTINHPNAGIGVFAGTTFTRGEIVCYFYGTLVYHDLSQRQEIHKTYGEGPLGVTPSQFRSYAMEVDVSGPDFAALVGLNRDTKRTSIFISPAPFCIGGYINDPRYIEGDMDIQAVRDKYKKKRTENVTLDKHKLASIRNRKQLEDYTIITIRATRRIERGEEFFLSYGVEYCWKSNLLDSRTSNTSNAS